GGEPAPDGDLVDALGGAAEGEGREGGGVRLPHGGEGVERGAVVGHGISLWNVRGGVVSVGSHRLCASSRGPSGPNTPHSPIGCSPSRVHAPSRPRTVRKARGGCVTCGGLETRRLSPSH